MTRPPLTVLGTPSRRCCSCHIPRQAKNLTGFCLRRCHSSLMRMRSHSMLRFRWCCKLAIQGQAMITPSWPGIAIKLDGTLSSMLTLYWPRHLLRADPGSSMTRLRTQIIWSSSKMQYTYWNLHYGSTFTPCP